MQPPLVTAVTFGAPNVGDTTFATDFDRRINTRNIEYVADIVPQLPCAGHMPLCGAGAAAAAGGGTAPAADAGGTAPAADAGSDSPEGEGPEDLEGDAEADADYETSSSSSSSGSVSYAQLGRRLQLEAVDMPLQQDAWSQLSTYRQVNNSTVA